VKLASGGTEIVAVMLTVASGAALPGTRTPALTHRLRMRHTCSDSCAASELDVSTPETVCEGV
jgi:hypothetical protein